MTDYDRLLQDHADRLRAAIRRLRSSLDRVRHLPADPAVLGDADLEVWESFVARFARASDLFLTRYVRSFVLRGDPGFHGTLRDSLEQAAKLNLIEDPTVWLEIRELRNLAAHEYLDEALAALFLRARELAPRLVAIEEKIANATERG